MDLIKVSSQSKTSSVAGAIAHTIRENGKAEIQTIGAGSLNQALKAMVLARSYLKDESIDLIFFPIFVDVEFDGKRRTAIKIIGEPR